MDLKIQEIRPNAVVVIFWGKKYVLHKGQGFAIYGKRLGHSGVLTDYREEETAEEIVKRYTSGN